MTSWSTLKLLTRHFSRRFLDNDLISPNGDGHVGVSQILALLIAPGLLFASILVFKYSSWHMSWDILVERSQTDCLLMASTAMIVAGVAATLTWDAFFLDARDALVLGVLPVSRRLVAAAKLAALLLFTAIFVAALGFVPTTIVPFLMLQRLDWNTSLSHIIPLTVAQALSVGLSGAWIILCVAVVRGATATLLPSRVFRVVGPALQGLLILGFLAWFMLLPEQLDRLRPLLRDSGPWCEWSPPMWFLGVHQRTIGHRTALFDVLAARGWLAVLLTLVAVGILIPFAPVVAEGAPLGRRGLRQSSAWATIRRQVARGLVRPLAGRAVFGFSLWILRRSASHRLYLAAALGAGIAWSASIGVYAYANGGSSAFAAPATPLLEVQFVLVLATAIALRFGVMIPVNLRANWIFRVTEQWTPASYLRGARAAALLLAAWPVVLLAPAHFRLWGVQVAAWHLSFGVAYTLLVVTALWNGLDRVPGTAAYISGQARFKTRGALYMLAVVFATWGPARLEELALPYPQAMETLIGLALLSVAVMGWRRAVEVRNWPGLVFDEAPGDAVQTLGLME